MCHKKKAMNNYSTLSFFERTMTGQHAKITRLYTVDAVSRSKTHRATSGWNQKVKSRKKKGKIENRSAGYTIKRSKNVYGEEEPKKRRLRAIVLVFTRDAEE